MPKHYVNLERRGDDEKHHSQFVRVGIETDTADSEDKTTWVFLEPNGGNLHLKKKEWFPVDARPHAFFMETPYRCPAIIKDKKGEAKMRLSLGGGDKFTFKYGKVKDKSDAKDTGLPELEVWRKIFVRVGVMPGGGVTPSIDAAKGEYANAFIELEQLGGMIRVPHEGWVRSAGDVVAKMNQGQANPPRPDQTAFVVFVDRIGQPGNHTYKAARIATAKIRSSLMIDWPLKSADGKKKLYTWPTKKEDWVTGKILLSHESGKQHIVRTDLHNFFKRRAKWKHPEGTVTDYLFLDLSPLKPEIDDWVVKGNGKVEIEVTVKILERIAAGRASGTSLIVSTNHPLTCEPHEGAPHTLTHELGHVFGMVLENLDQFDATSGKPAGTKKYDNHYSDSFGGRGHHCHSGASLTDDLEFTGGSCIMFHKSSGKTAFCGDCRDVLKRMRLDKLRGRW